MPRKPRVLDDPDVLAALDAQYQATFGRPLPATTDATVEDIAWAWELGKILQSKGRGARRRTGFVYAITDGAHIKVGIGRDPVARMRDLQVGNSYCLQLLWSASVTDAARTEAHMHRLLRENHVRGEWFDCDVATVKDAFTLACMTEAAEADPDDGGWVDP